MSILLLAARPPRGPYSEEKKKQSCFESERRRKKRSEEKSRSGDGPEGRLNDDGDHEGGTGDEADDEEEGAAGGGKKERRSAETRRLGATRIVVNVVRSSHGSEDLNPDSEFGVEWWRREQGCGTVQVAEEEEEAVESGSRVEQVDTLSSALFSSKPMSIMSARRECVAERAD
ncbi:hypothetical protein AXG93_2116s1000 [Marchantia polymorpha subsp. ruderalis]|uniref:Uncharacterized protein n=1 Tax=Marchantia polymorpha subsp. ruderalis TaxID=1480154 RepID=A0A176VNU1_MARPO|nr:hypothetical protein AXG93_2116s1000 [Marchantia polymorpha subsp. ruderalis]